MNDGVRHFVCFGVPFTLDLRTPSLRDTVEGLLPFSAEVQAESASGARFALFQSGEGYAVEAGEGVATRGMNAEEAIARLSHELMLHVASCAPRHVFVHAGVVGWRERALLFPGPSGAGKSTLVAELLRAGATYFSDEYAVLDELGRVHPYARSLQMRDGRGGQAQVAVPARAMGAGTAAAPARASHVVLTQFRIGAHWRPEAISAGAAALEMMRHAIAARRDPARVMAALARLTEEAVCLESPRGEARETAAALLRSLGENPQRGDESLQRRDDASASDEADRLVGLHRQPDLHRS